MPTSDRVLDDFKLHLYERERSAATAEKYVRAVRGFLDFAEQSNGDAQPEGHTVRGKKRRTTDRGAAPEDSARENPAASRLDFTKETVIAYKQQLRQSGYAVASVNAAIAGINCFLRYIGRPECCVRQLKMQRQIYRPQERELTKQEYLRLLQTAKRQGRQRLYMILQTIAGTGIRISELRFFTVEAVRAGRVVVACKNKNRVVLISKKLRAALLEYVKRTGINKGMIFVTRSGRAVNRGNVWAEMKALCASARVQPGKVFPHNLRKLFAAEFYSVDRDIAKLADVLGHSSINTTRIYIASSGREHLQRLDRLGLVV